MNRLRWDRIVVVMLPMVILLGFIFVTIPGYRAEKRLAAVRAVLAEHDAAVAKWGHVETAPVDAGPPLPYPRTGMIDVDLDGGLEVAFWYLQENQAASVMNFAVVSNGLAFYFGDSEPDGGWLVMCEADAKPPSFRRARDGGMFLSCRRPAGPSHGWTR